MILQNLLGWLRRTLFRRYEYIDLGDGYYLKVKRGTVAVVAADEVPARIRRPTETPTMRAARNRLDATPELPASSRISLLQRLLPLDVAHRAASSNIIRGDVLQHPELVDAESDYEARLKLAIAAGESLDPLLAQQPDLTESDLSEMLGTDWVAKWGYNTYGSELPAHLSGNPADDVGRSAAAEPKPTAHKAGQAKAHEGRKTVQARDISSSRERGRSRSNKGRPSSANGRHRPTVKASDVGACTKTAGKTPSKSGSTNSSKAGTSSSKSTSSGRPSHKASNIGSTTTGSSSSTSTRSSLGKSSGRSSGGSVGGGNVGGGEV